ncbi:lipid phosphate phosphatase 1 [Trametopsis cervina]|nr:lipid phosphate phosphatase 1 [Trametopsis cervina]
MADYLRLAQRRLRQTFGEDAFAWYDRSYGLDWAMATVAWVIAHWIKFLPPYERDFSTDDPLISHKHRPNQISGNMNMIVAICVPVFVVLAIGMLRASAIHMHHGLLSLYCGSGFTALLTEFLKNRVGRLRPDFLSRCKWKSALKACSGDLEKVQDGRRSFPSGHSSEAWAGMTFLSLFLAGVTGAWLLSHTAPPRAITSSRIARLCLTLAPIAYATWVAVSRIEDYRHHKEDVLVGSLLGAGTAATCYLIYWPNPFWSQEASSFGLQSSQPRNVYEQNGTRTVANEYGYELAGVEQAEASV